MLEEYGVTTSLVPMGGGWRYEQPFKDGFQRIPAVGPADTPDKLVAAIHAFRAMHNIPIGNIEYDLAEYIKRVSGINNRFPKRPPQPPPEVPKPALIHRIRDWLDSVATKRPKLVSQHEATQRADICLTCTRNVKWKTHCDPCNEEVEARGQNLRRVAIFKPSDSLGACQLHDLHLPSAVFLDIDHLPLAKEGKPDNCWLPCKPSAPS